MKFIRNEDKLVKTGHLKYTLNIFVRNHILLLLHAISKNLEIYVHSGEIFFFVHL